jgi:hypothetical protein
MSGCIPCAAGSSAPRRALVGRVGS